MCGTHTIKIGISMPNQDNTEHENKQNLNQSIQELDQDVKTLDHDIKGLNKSNSGWPSFWRGIIGSLGAVIGATIIISLVLYLLQRLSVLPVIGEIFRLALDHLKNKTPTP